MTGELETLIRTVDGENEGVRTNSIPNVFHFDEGIQLTAHYVP